MRQITYLNILLLSAMLGLSACGEISYKMGGTAQDYDKAQQSCRSAQEGYAKCLEKHGWQAQSFKGLDPLFAEVRVTDNRQPSVPSSLPIIQISPTPSQAEQANSAATPAKTPQLASSIETEKPTTNIPTTVRDTTNDGPDVAYVINSWWKMGAGPDALKIDQHACEKTLDANYLPDYKTQTFKRAFVVCMHDKGWKALRQLP